MKKHRFRGAYFYGTPGETRTHCAFGRSADTMSPLTRPRRHGQPFGDDMVVSSGMKKDPA